MAGRKSKLYKKTEILEAIKDSYGIIDTVAKKLKCEWHVAEKNIKRFPETIQAMNDEKEGLLDYVEGKAINAIKNGSETMIRYYLSTIGKKRGYTQEQSDDKEEIDNELTLTITDEAAE